MRVVLTPEQRQQRRRDSWTRIVEGQRRPGHNVPKVDDVVDDFRARFGGMSGTVTQDASLAYFGLKTGFTLGDLKTAFRKMIVKVHPDHGGTVEEAQRCVSMYETLERRF